MNGAILGVIVGLYAGNPSFRASVDKAFKKAVGYGIDTLNGKGAVIEPPQEAAEEE